MKKQEEKAPEEIAKDLENVVFAEIGEEDLREAFGGSEIPIQSNCNCCC